MGFWNKLGKIALVAAPYVAAPFTGGASLYFTGASNAAYKKWAAHDARKAAEKGLAPSKFDRYLGYGADAAGIASSMGAFNKLGTLGSAAGKAGTAASTAGKTAGQLSGWQNNLANAGKVSSAMMGQPTGQVGSGWQGQLADLGMRYAADQINRPRGDESVQPTNGISSFQGQLANQAVPRVPAMSAVERGRQDALRNQPFRAGYDTTVQGDDDQIITDRMPPIYPQYQSPPVSESGSQTPVSPFMDNLTPRRMARRRNPVEEEQVYE